VGRSGLKWNLSPSKIRKWGIDVFRGVININMDAKGRMAMPTKHRDALISSERGHLIATIDIHSRCLVVYPAAEWLDNIEPKLQTLPSFDADAKKIKRLILGYAAELEMDGSGRVLLPASLREYANLDKKIVLVGQGKGFELWSEDAWLEETNLAIADANSGELKIPEELKGLVL
jgi:MraZ protein